MPSRDEFIKEVGDFLAKSKSLGGIGLPVQWQPNRDPAELCIKLPIELEGVVSAQRLIVVYSPASEALRFSILIVYRVAVCRMDFDETGGHTNGFGNLEGLPMTIQGSHFHRWSNNIRFVKGNGQLEELDNAEPIPIAIRTFDAALRWFCDEAKIALPHNHNIALPAKVLI